MMTRRRFVSALLAASVCPLPALGETFPERPMRLLVPYAAGGGTDAIARLIANGVSERLGQSVVVENNGGAGGNVATAQVASAPPDGYTVLMANQGPMVVNPHLFKHLRVNPLTAFDPLTLITAAPLIMVVPKGSRFASMKQLVEEARAGPGKLTYGSAGVGSASHLATVLLESVAGLKMVHVPYRGAGPALNDLLGGRVDFMITTLPSVLGLIDGASVAALAVTSKVRTARFPDVPSIAELGWPTYEATAWYGFVVPKGTPTRTADRLRVATIQTIRSPQIQRRLAEEGAEPIGNTPEEFAAMMKAESRRWADVIASAGLKVD